MLILNRSLEKGNIKNELVRIQSLSKKFKESSRIFLRYRIEFLLRKLLGRKAYLILKNTVLLIKKTLN